ncbi:MAG: DUF6174 domain-containing protein [Treponema sp.]|nr:DUF6174 domain-containing protein [Treponema sp.]
MKAMVWCGVIVSLAVLSCTGIEDMTGKSFDSENAEKANAKKENTEEEKGTAASETDGKIPAQDEEETTASCDGDILFWDGDVFDAEFSNERAAWQAQGLRHYRFVTTPWSGSIYWKMFFKITVFPDRDPEVVVHSEEPCEEKPFYGKTIDEFYQYIANQRIAGEGGLTYNFQVRYNKQYHYPEYLLIYPEKISYRTMTYAVTITEFENLGK